MILARIVAVVGIVKQKKTAILVLFVLISAVYLAIYLLWLVDIQTRTSIIAAVVTALIAIFTLAKQKQKDLDLKMREQKLPAYEKSLDLFKSILAAMHKKEILDEQDIIRQYREINYALILAGSQSVVVKWVEYYNWISESATIDDEIELAFRTWAMRLKLAQVAREIRKDLGHKDDLLSDEAIADLLLPLQHEAKQEMIAKLTNHIDDSK